MVPPLRRVTFGKRPEAGPAKSNQKVCAPPLGTSLTLGAEWWGKSVLLTFVWAGFRIHKSEAL